MSGLRDELRRVIEGIEEPEPPSWSKRLANYSREVQQAHKEIEERRAAEAIAAAAPPRKSLADELKGLIAGQAPSWEEVRSELDRSRQQRQQSAVDGLKEAIAESDESDGSIPLNGQKILDAASAALDGNQSVKESVASLLYRYRGNQ